MYQDPEINAMSQVVEVLAGLDNRQITRILDWISSKFELTESERKQQPSIKQPADVVEEKITAEEPTEVSSEPANLDGKAVEPAPPGAEVEVEAEAKDKTVTRTPSTKGLGLKRFKSIENLFLASNIKTVASRILLAAAYLQEKHNFKEVSSFDINSRLKKMGYGITNITTAINGLLAKKPPLMVQTRKVGDTKQAKRKFIVTEDGLKIAKTYLRSAGEGE